MDNGKAPIMPAAYRRSMGGLGGALESKSARGRQVEGLLELAEQLQGILVPVEPATGFRRRLQGDLILQAQRRPEAPGPAAHKLRTGILLGAAFGSTASLIGIIVALLIRFRRGRATHAA